MEALSIRQPWAWLICKGIKDIENRSWKTGYRGKLIIHASMAWDQEGYEFITHVMGERIPGKKYHHYGMLLGVVEMVDCVNHHPSKWFFGPWGFVFEKAKMINTPIRHKGALGIFKVPDPIVGAILEDNYSG